MHYNRAAVIVGANTLTDLIETLREKKDWVGEIHSLSELIDKLKEIGKSTSVRDLARVVDKSKSWVAVSIDLIKGLKTYPEIEKCSNRNEAYTYLMKKKKLRRFLES